MRTVKTAVRMLDNVIDINFYTIPEARRSNLRHRPVGLGLMGFQDALQALRLLGRGLPAVKRDPNDLAARLDCQIGAWISMIGIVSGTRMGASHAIGHILDLYSPQECTNYFANAGYDAD